MNFVKTTPALGSRGVTANSPCDYANRRLTTDEQVFLFLRSFIELTYVASGKYSDRVASLPYGGGYVFVMDKEGSYHSVLMREWKDKIADYRKADPTDKAGVLHNTNMQDFGEEVFDYSERTHNNNNYPPQFAFTVNDFETFETRWDVNSGRDFVLDNLTPVVPVFWSALTAHYLKHCENLDASEVSAKEIINNKMFTDTTPSLIPSANINPDEIERWAHKVSLDNPPVFSLSIQPVEGEDGGTWQEGVMRFTLVSGSMDEILGEESAGKFPLGSSIYAECPVEYSSWDESDYSDSLRDMQQVFPVLVQKVEFLNTRDAGRLFGGNPFSNLTEDNPSSIITNDMKLTSLQEETYKQAQREYIEPSKSSFKGLSRASEQ